MMLPFLAISLSSGETGGATATAGSLLSFGGRRLRNGGIESPVQQAQLLLAHLLHLTGKELQNRRGNLLEPAIIDEFLSGIDRILRHEPLQYIIGETVFMGLALTVTPDVLIPRPETELLVELVVDRYRNRRSPLVGLDVGTGSANIPIALCALLPHVKVFSIDKNPDALAIARNNIAAHHVEDRVVLFQADFLGSIPAEIPDNLDFLISNPPYISAAEYDALPPNVRFHEPPSALTDGKDGLSFFPTLAAMGMKYLRLGGWIDVETAYDQAVNVRSLFERAGFSPVSMIKDYNGIERFVSAQKNRNLNAS